MNIEKFLELEDISYTHRKVSGIYVIVCLHNKKIYIGSAKSLYNRKATHLCDLHKNRHGNMKLQNIFNKYGLSNMFFKVLELCSIENVITREQFWIDSFDFKNELLNLSPTASSCLGTKRSLEVRKKQSKTMTGRKLSHSHREKIGLAHKGKERSQQAKENITKANKARVYTEKDKLHIQNLLGCKVKMIDVETFEAIKVFPSISEAARVMGLYDTSIIEALKRKNGTSGGYLWLYENQEIVKPIDKVVISIDKKNNELTVYSSLREAGEILGKSIANISNCINGHIKSVYGCTWHYGFILP